jgi:hypothetical protein
MNNRWWTMDDEQQTTLKDNGQWTTVKNNRQWMMSNGQWMVSNRQPGELSNCPPPLIFSHEMQVPLWLTMDSDEQGVVLFLSLFLYLSMYLCCCVGFLTFTLVNYPL